MLGSITGIKKLKVFMIFHKFNACSARTSPSMNMTYSQISGYDLPIWKVPRKAVYSWLQDLAIVPFICNVMIPWTNRYARWIIDYPNKSPCERTPQGRSSRSYVETIRYLSKPRILGWSKNSGIIELYLKMACFRNAEYWNFLNYTYATMYWYFQQKRQIHCWYYLRLGTSS